MARIAIGGYSHETNCFVPMRTEYEHYAQGGKFPPLARREEVIERSKGATFGMSGFLDTIDPSHELVPLIWGQGGAGGYITDDCFERIVGELVGMLSQGPAMRFGERIMEPPPGLHFRWKQDRIDKAMEDLDVPLNAERLKQWCEDINRAQSDVSYDFVFVDEESFKNTAQNNFPTLLPISVSTRRAEL